ncbi:MAG TPA: cellulase family glycosylhydrolase [Hanamia sp.]
MQKQWILFNQHINFIVNRKNVYTGIKYKNDPTIMSWELANEPRGVDNVTAYLRWINSTAGLIKNLDHNHLVTTGSEGATSDPLASGTNFFKDHSSKNIDYTTIHIWVQNWNYYDPEKADSTYSKAVNFALEYLNNHILISKKLNKPLVLEEFGISRDLDSHDPASAVTVRDNYFEKIFEEVYKRANQKECVIAGCNFWAWGGEGRPGNPGGIWKLNDDFIGDPPHEFQGWYSVYDKDSSTISIIKKYALRMDNINKKEQHSAEEKLYKVF